MSENVTKLPAQPVRHPIVFQLGDTLIDGAVIKPLTFAGFVDCIAGAQQLAEPKIFEARLRRLRMMKQVIYHSGNTIVPMTMENMLKLPIPAARIITSHLDDDEGMRGKIIRDGDGIDKAIVYELGTPISLGQGKAPIKELEFHATTFGDIEDVLAIDTAIQQALTLIATIAKPLGTSLSLLPSWAINQITIADGVIISRDVLPRFLGSPDE